MHTAIQRHFRYYLAAFLSILLAVGVRLQTAPLGSNAGAAHNAPPSAAPVVQPGSVVAAVASR
ncbi:hypothetical protein [Hymenobacter lapidarius]|uniref:hypothetical protein n=1 Tax=Hymenobacter lapidarius TaxID=1908237 RepID=UPI000F7AB0AD|nr:hypothetical protein [Hymenobacter lapidarius]